MTLDPTRVLVIEDSAEVVALLERVLGDHGFDVLVANDADAGLRLALEERPDLVIVDIGLPGRDGLDVTAEMRRRHLEAPMLMLTARDTVADRVAGLEAGADDYLGKPFDSDELLARLRALLRRAAVSGRPPRLHVGELTLDPVTREVWRRDLEVSLTPREFALLEFLMRNPGRTVSRATLIQHVWKLSPDDLDAGNIVEVYVAYLRKKIDAGSDEPMLHTVRGVGYVLRAPAHPADAGA